MSVDDLGGLSAHATGEEIASGGLDGSECLSFWSTRAESDSLNSFLWTGSSGEQEIKGAPVAVKDIFCTKGVPTTAGSRILDGYIPPYDATAVEKLRAAGLPILGKTNMDEFAMGSSNENSAYGPVLNPWDRTRVPGGSSGGSAAAVAGGGAPWALGTDTGGSIRQPAAFCGIVGIKPTYGAVSRYGMIAFASSLDQCGTFGRSVTDATQLLAMVEGRDPRDSTSTGIPGGLELPSAEDLEGLVIGVPRNFLEMGVEPGVADRFSDALRTIEGLGASVRDIELPHAELGISAYYVIAPAEASTNLSRYDGVRYGLRVPADDLVEMYERTRGEGFGPEVKRRVMLGTYALSSGYYDQYYGTAQRVRTLIVRDFEAAFQGVDLIATPTTPGVAFELGAKTADPWTMYLNDLFTVPMSLAGIPALSIPVGLASPPGDGPELPVGLQLAAPAFSEQRLVEAAHAIEGAIGFESRPASASGGQE